MTGIYSPWALSFNNYNNFSSGNNFQNNAQTSAFCNGSMNNMLQGFGMIFAGMDMLDNNQMDGSFLRSLAGFPNQQQAMPMQQPFCPSPPMPFQQNNIAGQNPMMQMMMQMMGMIFGMFDMIDDGQVNGSVFNQMLGQNGMPGNSPFANNSPFNGSPNSSYPNNPYNNGTGGVNNGPGNSGSYNNNNDYEGPMSNKGIFSSKNANVKADNIYKEHEQMVNNTKLNLTGEQARDLQNFKNHYQKNKSRYERVSQKTGIPSELVAAIHWREADGNFGTYLHNGDPLGKPSVHVPRNIPVFNNWEDAAVHALNMKKGIKEKFGLNSNSKDYAAMSGFAEYYNGLGYHNKGKASPYVYSGTNMYDRGKYVADGVYSASTKDKQLGVMAMLIALA